MKTLQKLFESLLHERFSPKKLGAILIERKLRSLGIIIGEEQLQVIEEKLETIEGDELTFEIADEQLANAAVNRDLIKDNRISLEIGDAKEVDDFITNLFDCIADTIPEIISETSQHILEGLKSEAPAMLRERQIERVEFETNIRQLWGEAIDLLEMLIAIALEAGADFNEEFREMAAQNQDFVFDALTRLQARACQVASEILILLKAGYADGAHARWRSLHEITVVAMFIKESGQDVAERYILHNAIESFKAAQEYQQHCLALGYDPIPSDEFDIIRQQRDAPIKRYGSSYNGSYGWASAAIGREDPTIKDIEQAVGLAHLRPYYRLASHNIHANPKGVFFKLGLYSVNEDLLLAGPSSTGLADPGHGTAISLLQITVTLLASEPNLDRLAICTILTKLEQEIGEAFINAHGKSNMQRAA